MALAEIDPLQSVVEPARLELVDPTVQVTQVPLNMLSYEGTLSDLPRFIEIEEVAPPVVHAHDGPEEEPTLVSDDMYCGLVEILGTEARLERQRRAERVEQERLTFMLEALKEAANNFPENIG